MTDELVETVRFGSWALDAPDRFDEWSQHSGNHILERGARRFRAEVAFWVLDGIVVSEQRLDAFSGARTAERLAAAPTGQVTLVAVLEGGMTYRADGETGEVADAGDAVLLDFRRLYRFEVTQGRTVVISLDRSVLEHEAGPLTLAGLMPRTPETGMLVDFADALARRLPGMAAASAAPAAAALRRLFASALRRGHPVVDPALRARRVAAIAYMDERPPGQLDPAALAEALGITRSTLYRLFQDDGGVLAYDRRRRLRLLHRALGDERASETLGELGARHGFLDLSNLSRQFRQQFGLSMSDVRRHLLPRAGPAGPAGRYRAAVERFA